MSRAPFDQSYGPLQAYAQPPPKNQPQKPLAGEGRRVFCFDFIGILPVLAQRYKAAIDRVIKELIRYQDVNQSVCWHSPLGLEGRSLVQPTGSVD
jgi:hypothetical protein